MNLNPGALLQGGKYRIVRFIKSGGFGCTYEAVHVLSCCTVAIKEFFVRDFCNRDSVTGNVHVLSVGKQELVDKLCGKFIDEAQMMMKMRYPGIVRVTDVFKENGTAYYVMDYIDGKSLGDIVAENGPLGEEVAVEYIKSVAAALKYVHGRNCLHLDVKPANILLANDGTLHLIDFGVSKQYDEVANENTSTLMGSTPGYAPPEQTGNSLRKFTPAADIYALGATLYKLLTGITPVNASLRSSGEELDPLPPAISASVRHAVEASMQMNKNKRPQSVEEFLGLVESEEVRGESGKMKDATSIFGNASSDGSSAASQNVMPLGSQKASVAKEQESIFGNASSDGSSAASQNVMPLGSQKASVAKVESEGTKIESNATSLSMGTGQNTANGNAAVEENEIEVEVVETPSVAPEPAPRPQPEENQKKNKWLWIIILLVIICGAAGGFMLLGGGRDDAVVKDSANKKDSVNKEITVAENTINGHEYVDLGLPSGLKWATCNVGANKPEEYGNHYAWGETSTKSSYTPNNSVTYRMNFSDIGGDPTYDVARKEWGSTWRLPTTAEFEELLNENNSTWTWTTQNGIRGYKVTSKKNGNSIFLPAAGKHYGSSLNDQETYGGYWSSTPYTYKSYGAYGLSFGSGGHDTNWDNRYNGKSVRPVSGGIENKTEKTSNAKPASNKLSTRTFKVKGVEFTMVAVEGGTFSMGSNDGDKNEKPIHQVTLDSYCIGQTEVTQALWQAIMGTTIYDQAKKGAYNNRDLYGTGNNNPMYYISYNDCIDFINQLNTLLKDQLPQGRKFRLPTEAEWEYAARGGNKSKGYKYSGSDSISTVAWYKDNSGSKTHPVKQKASNELGLYDMSGNVSEWCSDRYGRYYYSSSSQNNPKGPGSGSLRVLRGGGWSSFEEACRSAIRGYNVPGYRNSHYGLRLAF